MAGEWARRGVPQTGYGLGGYSRTISWDEFNHFKKTGELPDVGGALPVQGEEIFSFYGLAPPKKTMAHHEAIWPGTHPGRNRLGWPSKPDFRKRRLRLVASK
jgi:hypothetical protein